MRTSAPSGLGRFESAGFPPILAAGDEFASASPLVLSPVQQYVTSRNLCDVKCLNEVWPGSRAGCAMLVSLHYRCCCHLCQTEPLLCQIRTTEALSRIQDVLRIAYASAFLLLLPPATNHVNFLLGNREMTKVQPRPRCALARSVLPQLAPGCC